MATEQTVNPKEVSSWQVNKQWTPHKSVHGSCTDSGHHTSQFMAAEQDSGPYRS